MTGLTEVIESELNSAIFKEDKEAVKRLSYIIAEKIEKIEEVDKTNLEIKSDIKILAEVMKKGFEDINKRFEDLYKYMDKRFEAVDKRFEDIYRYMDKRFEEMNNRFNMMFKFMSLGFSIITILIVIFKFIR